MIKRHYFMTYRTGKADGPSVFGSMTGTSTSWLPDPAGILELMIKLAKAEADGQEIAVSLFQRIR